MSFLFGSSKNVPQDEPKLFGAQNERIDTNQSARVLPWFAGTRWLGVTWVGDVFNVRTTPVKQKVGKKKQTTGYNYYASFCGLICAGPVDRVTKIWFDDELVWSGSIERSDEDYVSITVESRGVIRLYWGTETQTLDDDLAASGQNFSPMRGQCYIVGDDIYFGTDRTNAPNIVLELSRWSYPSWISSEQAILGNVDANPIAVLWEWWTDARFGLGLSEDDLDIVRLTAAAARLAEEDIGVSPLLTGQSDLKGALLKLLEHSDGYPTSENGKLGIELCRSTSAAVPAVTKEDLLEDPTFSTQTWPETFDEVRVAFKDYLIDGNDNVAKHHELANFRLTGQHRVQSLDRPWVIRQSVAVKIAGASGRVLGLPQSSGSMRLRESSANGIHVGSVFDWATRDGATIRLRCEKRTEPPVDGRGVDIEFVSDSSWANSTFYYPAADEIADTPIYEPSPPFAVRLQDSPYALAEAYGLATQQRVPSLLYFVARGDTYSNGYDVWRGGTAEGPFISSSGRVTQFPSVFQNFSILAKLIADYQSGTLPIDDVVGIQFEVLSPDQSLLDDEWSLGDALEHQLLAFMGESVTEIMSLWDVAKTGDTTYTAKTVRGLYDTRRRTHPSGTELWLQLRVKVDNDAWSPFSENSRWYKVQTLFGAGELDLSTVDPIEKSENGRSLRPIAPANLRVNDDPFTATWAAGEDVTVQWSNTSRERTVFGLPLNEAPPTDLTSVAFELRSADGLTLLDSFETDPDEETTLTSAYLVEKANASFRLRAYGKRDGWTSLDYSEVSVQKV